MENFGDKICLHGSHEWTKSNTSFSLMQAECSMNLDEVKIPPLWICWWFLTCLTQFWHYGFIFDIVVSLLTGGIAAPKIRQWRSNFDFQGLFGRKKWTFNLDLAKAAKIECHPAKIERAQMVPRTPSRKGPTGLKLVSMSLLGGHFGWVFRVPNGRQSRNNWWSLSHWTEMGRAAMWFLGHQWRSETTLH